MSKKVVTDLGTRPQLIKDAVVSRALKNTEGVQEVVVNTGQHYDHLMNQVFFDELQIDPPQYYLGIGSASHSVQTARMMVEIEQVV